MFSAMQRLFSLFATDATMQNEKGKQTVRVFFQSVNSRSWQNMERIFGPMGEIPRGQYVCILPAGTAVAGDVLTMGQRSYRICRVEDMTVAGKVLYQWSLCKEKGEADTWG